MAQEVVNVVYQTYGKKEILYQTIYSIYSILDYTKQYDFQIVIYTDQIQLLKNYFNAFNFIKYELITPENMEEWRGAIKFHHRMKIEILKDCSKKYGGHILYLDGDTYFTKDIHFVFNDIKENQSVMHLPEHQLNKTKDPLTKKLYKFLKKTSIKVKNQEVKIDPNFIMWNAGVIGLHQKHHDLFDRIIEYTDALYSQYQKHIMEQFAVSYMLQTRTSLVRSDQIIEHYWNQKDSFEEAIVPFFNKNQHHTDFLKNRNTLILPKRYYDVPRYTFKQKMKRKWNLLKHKLYIERFPGA